MWQPGREGDLRKNGCMSMYGWVPLLSTWNYHNIVNQLLSSVPLLSPVRLFATPWTTVHQDSLSITNSRGLLKFMSVESVMPSKHLILCHPLLLLPSIFPASGSFPVSRLFASGGQIIGASASASSLPRSCWRSKHCFKQSVRKVLRAYWQQTEMLGGADKIF